MRELVLLLCGFFCWHFVVSIRAQENLTADHTREVKVIIGPSAMSSNTVIAVPPVTSWTGTIAAQGSNSTKRSTASDVTESLRAVSALNGIDTSVQQPWHIVIAYEQFDQEGDNVHSGTIEEYWIAPKKYKISYKSDTLNQTDYATEQGLFRLGNQRWPNHAEAQVLAEVLNPFSYARTLQDVRIDKIERMFGPHSLHCLDFKRLDGVSILTQYCFEDAGSVLRYAHGGGWFQTAYNDMVQIVGRSVARDVEVVDGGHRFLSIRVKTVEVLPMIDEKEFIPPVEAVNLTGQRVTGVNPRPVRTSFPEWPSPLRSQHFSVTVQIVIGKDGKVIQAHAIDGPPEAFKSAESAASKWQYQPYLVLGEPAEVETKIQLSNN